MTIFNTAYVQRPLPRGGKIPLASEAKVKWFLCDQAEETSGSVPPWSCQISRRTAYKPFRRLNLCFFNGFSILLSGVEESIHLFQYFMDCVCECWKAGEGDNVTDSTLQKLNSLLLKDTDDELKTSFVLWLPSVNHEVYTTWVKSGTLAYNKLQHRIYVSRHPGSHNDLLHHL